LNLGSVTAMTGRRQVLRATLEQSIRDAALAELRRSGPSELSLREVARGANISPSGLYRYVDGRDGLLVLLIADGFQRFGAAIGEAINSAGPLLIDRTTALAITYRRWAKENPEQFALILGTPVIGLRPEPGGITSRAVLQFGMPMFGLLVDAYVAGELGPIPDAGDPVDLSDFSPTMGVVPAGLIDIAMRSWARIHGIVILEAFGHLAWTGRGVEDLLTAEAVSIATSFGKLDADPKSEKKRKAKSS
jgi:AcrR family transcriptional regulator